MLCDLTQSYAETGGGIRTYLHEKRRWLLQTTPHRHVLVVPGAEDAVHVEGRATTVTVRSPYVPGSTSYRLMLRNRAVRRALAEAAPDVIETLDAYNLPWAALAHRREHPGTAVIGGYRTDFPRAYVSGYGERLVGRVLPDRAAQAVAGWAERRADAYAARLYRRMDRVYTLSPKRAEALQHLGVPDVAVLPLGVDLGVFRPEARSDARRASWGLSPGRPPASPPAFVYVGRLDSEKRPDLVVDAFEKLPVELGAALVLVGEGPMRADLEGRAAQLRAAGRTLVVAPYETDRGALAETLASADLYVSAMAHETFGISVAEAQACGLPVVGVDAGAMPARVPPSVGRLATPDDAGAFADQVLSVLDGHVAAMSLAARAHAEEHYDWSRTFQRVLEIYDSALAARARRGTR